MISVIVPLYNKEGVVERTIRSVLEQSYRDIELIIVDDGSTDNSFAVAERVVASVPDRQEQIKLLRQENGGPSAARNTGSRNAQGEWILFLDADDELLPGALETLAGAADRHTSADFISAPYYDKAPNGRRLVNNFREEEVTDVFRRHFYGTFITRMGSAIYRKALVVENLFDERIRRYEDLEVLLRMYRIAKIYTIDTPVMTTNFEYSAASHPRKDINEDFLGHLDFMGKSFWERMCTYKFYLYEREHYKEGCRRLYPMLHCRYDLLLMYKLLMWIGR